tara:strand:- start:571 stop:876 length:306 start_codon:yes stop_codon:yes gene_type:complete
MKILGYIMAKPLILAILAITSVSSIVLLISKPTEDTLGENTFTQEEILDLMVRTRNDEELHLRVTGKNTTEVVQNLKPILKNLASSILGEKSCHSIQLVEG